MAVSAARLICRLRYQTRLIRKRSRPIGPISLGVKPTGKPSAGKRHAGFDVAGAGNVTMGAGLRTSPKGLDVTTGP